MIYMQYLFSYCYIWILFLLYYIETIFFMKQNNVKLKKIINKWYTIITDKNWQDKINKAKFYSINISQKIEAY